MIGKLDKEVIEKFQEFQEKTGKHSELYIEDVEFEEFDIFNDKENIELIGSKKIGSHEELEKINDKDGIPVYDASANILTYIKQDKFPNEAFTVKKNENPDISFASEGNSSAGTNFIIHKDNYFVNNHRTVIKFTDKYYSKYVYYNIYKMKDKYGFKRGYIPSQTELKRLKITIPIPKDLNKFYSSYQIQEAIVEFLEYWKENLTDIERGRILKKRIVYQKIKELVVKNTFKNDAFIINRFNDFVHSEGYPLSFNSLKFVAIDIFNDEGNIKLIGAKKIGSHKELESIKDKNGIPVYDASSNILTFIDKEKYPNQVFAVKNNDNPDISFASEGNSSAGTNFIVHKDSYYINNHRTVMKFSDKYYGKYIYYNILDMKKKYGFKRGYIPSQLELKKLKIQVYIPKDIDEFYNSYRIQKILVDFWENFIDQIDYQMEIFDRIEDVSNRIDKAFIYRTFSKIEWRQYGKNTNL